MKGQGTRRLAGRLMIGILSVARQRMAVHAVTLPTCAFPGGSVRYAVIVLAGFFIPVAVFAETGEEKAATIKYLSTLQDSNGGFFFSATREKPATVSATSAAVRALKYFGGQVPDKDNAARFVVSCFDSVTGGFADVPSGKSTVSSTALGLLAAADLGVSLKPYSKDSFTYLLANCKGFEDIRIAAAGVEALQINIPKNCTWLRDLKQMQNPDGGYGESNGIARDTGGAVVAVLRLGGKVDRKAKIVELLKAGQREDGGFGKSGSAVSDLETCYRVMRAFHMLKELPDTAGMRKFVYSCRNSDGGYGFSRGQPSNAAGTYFAGIVLNWLQ